MNLQASFLSEQMVRQVGWVLVHFLWQGLAAAAAMWILLKLLTKASSAMRYAAACAGLCLMTAAPIVTFILINSRQVHTIASMPLPDVPAPVYYERPAEMQAIAAIELSPVQRPLKRILLEKLEASLPYWVLGWLAGVLALSLWYLGGWCQLQKLRLTGTRSVSALIEKETAALTHRLGISKAVGIAESALVQVPTAIGWLKPVILLPASALTGLDEMQLRAMIAHELAHIKRGDYLVNMLQTAIEILGFYHPAVWWISKQIRIERENCCDDIAVELTQNKTEYAKALFSMEQIRVGHAALAMSSSGGSLSDRIRRLIAKSECSTARADWMSAVLTIVLVMAPLVGAAIAMNSRSDQPEADGELIVYAVNRNISQFPPAEDFSTPENAYAAINRVMADESTAGWLRGSTEEVGKRIAEFARFDKQADPEWAKVVLNAYILEVRKKGNVAIVIARLPQEFSSKKIINPIDCRYVEFENGKWLNAGEDRFDHVEQAAAKFSKRFEIQKETEDAHRAIFLKPEPLESKAKELFNELRKVDYAKVLSYYDEETGKWKQDGWKKLDLDYCVHTDWPSFALWVCRTFKDNAIESVELGKVFESEKEFSKGLKAPAIPYKLTLRNGAILQGDLYFTYQGNDQWQPAEGIDWHLMTAPLGTAADGMLWESRNRLRELYFARHMYILTSSNSHARLSRLEDLKLKRNMDLASYTRLSANLVLLDSGKTIYSSDANLSPIAYDKTLPEFMNGTNVLYADGHVEYHSLDELNKLLLNMPLMAEDTQSPSYTAIDSDAAMEAAKQQSMEALNRLALAYFMFVDDHDKGVSPPDIQTLKPYLDEQTYAQLASNAVLLWTDAYPDDQSAAASPVAYDRTFLEKYGRRIIVFMDGHVEVDINDGLKQTLDTAIRYANMSRLKYLSVELMIWENENNGIFPPSFQQLPDTDVKRWAVANVKYLAAGKMLAEIKKPMTEMLAYDRSLLDTQAGAAILYADGHIEFHSIQELPNILPQEFSSGDMPGGMGGMGGPGSAANTPYLQGRVYDADSNPIAGAIVQIRQKREPGMTGIAAPDVITDKDGYYRYDAVKWPYKVGVLRRSIEDDGPTWYSQYIGENRYYEGLQTIDIRFNSEFPKGDCVLEGQVFGPDKQVMTDFVVRVENLPDWEAQPPLKNHQYVLQKRFKNDQGRFEIAGLPMGTHCISINGFDEEQLVILVDERFEAQIANLTDESVNQCNFSATPGLMIVGTVVDSKGQPAAGALVLPMPHGGDPVITDAEGKFRIAGPSQDPAVDRRIDFLLVRNPQTNEAAMANLDSLANPARIQLQPAVTITGFVKDSGGRPLGGADVQPSVLNGWEAYFGGTHFNLTDSDGRFEIAALPSELEYNIHASAHEFESGEERLGRFGRSGRVEIDPIVLAQAKQIAIEAWFILASDALKSKMGLEQEKVSGQLTEGLANSELILNAMKFKPLNEQQLQTERFFTIDDTQRDFLLEEVQKWENATQLAAPKAVVLNDESAHMQVKTVTRYNDIDDKIRDIDTGVQWQILPSIQNRGNVLLRANAQLTDISGYRTQENNGKTFEVPWVQIRDIRFQTVVESGKTIVVVGPKLTNPSFITEPRSLFILLKPTVISETGSSEL
ncbi:MAG: M48 family metalloprotease [Planctomycetaceae bacterium]|nr:M48 family metalloprotease [Planctomycetaceae bacterium]